MSNLHDEIRESIDNFKKPAGQAVRNFVDDVNDSIYVKANDLETEKDKQESKGCLSKIAISVAVIAFIYAFYYFSERPNDNKNGNNSANVNSSTDKASSSATDNASNNVVSETTNDNFNNTPQNDVNSNEISEDIYGYSNYFDDTVEYCKNNGISIIRFPEKEKALEDWEEQYVLSASKKHYVKEQTHVFTGKIEYELTERFDGFIYYGDVVDNKLTGKGVLYKRTGTEYGTLVENGANLVRYYIGEFKDGCFDGFGIKYECSEERPRALLSCFSEEDLDKYFDWYYLKWENSLEYFGMFSGGREKGQGNYFSLFDVGSLPNGHNLNDLLYSYIEVGEFDGDKLNGKAKEYYGTKLYYDGEYKNGEKHGYGKLYYFNSDSLKYEGEFKYDKRHGYGTSYSESGEMIYQGQWANDDYSN